jgi:hypothetical protein
VVANSADNGKTITSPQVTLEGLTKRVTFLWSKWPLIKTVIR